MHQCPTDEIHLEQLKTPLKLFKASKACAESGRCVRAYGYREDGLWGFMRLTWCNFIFCLQVILYKIATFSFLVNVLFQDIL